MQLAGLDLTQYGSWSALVAAARANFRIVGDGGLQDGYVPSMPGIPGPIQVLWDDSGNISALNFANPDRSGWNIMLGPGANDTTLRKDYEQQNGWAGVPWGALAVLAAPLAVSALGVGVGAGAGAGVEAGSIGAGSVVADEFANETAKLLLQQGLAQSGVDLLSTSLPTVVLDAGTAAGSVAVDEFANETAKLAQQQALADSGVDLLSTSLPTVSLGPSSLTSLSPSWSDFQKAIGAVKAVTGGVAAGTVAATRGATYGNGLPVNYQAGSQVALPVVQQEENWMPWLFLGLAALAYIGS